MLITYNLAHTFIVLMQSWTYAQSIKHNILCYILYRQLGVGQIIQQSMMMFTCILLMNGVYSIHILASCHLEIVELSK